jgi:hypothetical protein
MTSSQFDPLDQLREQFPEWRFGAVWVTAASGPDQRLLVAVRNRVTLSAFDADNLAYNIREHEGGNG